MEFKKNQIVMITKYYPNGNKSRLVGVITTIDPPDEKGRQRCTINPLPESMAKPIRDRYCQPDGFIHQGIRNGYADKYGFSCNHVHPDTTVVLGQVEVVGYSPWLIFQPRPGDTGYDLMC